MTRAVTVLGCVCLAGVLVACGEKTSGESGVRKSDVPAWQGSSGASNAFVADGWKAGDQASWEQQMRNRSRGQNEYSRTTP
jgi:hypothetical protein